jgi:hypothetical protein
MPSENQLAQMAAARALSMKNNSCYPDHNIPMVKTDKEYNSDVDMKSNDDNMYRR